MCQQVRTIENRFLLYVLVLCSGRRRSLCTLPYSFYFSIILGSLGLLLYLKNEVPLMYTLEGVSSVANFITAFEESQKNLKLPFSNL